VPPSRHARPPVRKGRDFSKPPTFQINQPPGGLYGYQGLGPHRRRAGGRSGRSCPLVQQLRGLPALRGALSHGPCAGTGFLESHGRSARKEREVSGFQSRLTGTRAASRSLSAVAATLEAMSQSARCWAWLLLSGVLVGCAAAPHTVRRQEAGCEQEAASFGEVCQHESSLLAVCEGQQCAAYRCWEVAVDAGTGSGGTPSHPSRCQWGPVERSLAAVPEGSSRRDEAGDRTSRGAAHLRVQAVWRGGTLQSAVIEAAVEPARAGLSEAG